MKTFLFHLKKILSYLFRESATKRFFSSLNCFFCLFILQNRLANGSEEEGKNREENLFIEFDETAS